MSVVYHAVEDGLDRRVALKVMAEFLSADEAYRKRFVAEGRAASSVEHPGVVPIFAFGELDGQLYLAMRFIDGTDLRSVLRRVPPPAMKELLPVLLQVADALDAVHEHGLVHRDIKPENILVHT